MLIIESTKLKDIKIEWLHNKKEAPFMQGEAINKLRKEYKVAKKYGYMLLNGREEILPEGCYYLLELKTDLEDGNGANNALVAFKENGDNIEGYAIFKNSDLYFLKNREKINTESRKKTIENIAKVTEKSRIEKIQNLENLDAIESKDLLFYLMQLQRSKNPQISRHTIGLLMALKMM